MDIERETVVSSPEQEYFHSLEVWVGVGSSLGGTRISGVTSCGAGVRGIEAVAKRRAQRVDVSVSA